MLARRNHLKAPFFNRTIAQDCVKDQVMGKHKQELSCSPVWKLVEGMEGNVKQKERSAETFLACPVSVSCEDTVHST